MVKFPVENIRLYEKPPLTGLGVIEFDDEMVLKKIKRKEEVWLGKESETFKFD